jgi:hypothetical protein
VESTIDRSSRIRVESGSVDRPSDRVDISDRARFLSQLAALPDVRGDLISSVRDQIARGTYETTERLDAAISSLLDELDVQN